MSGALLEERLAAPLDGSRVKQRPNGRGGQLSYIETHDAIRAANEIFGFGKWGHEIVSHKLIDTVVVHNSEGKAGIAVGYVCVVKLTVDGCVPTSGVGFGDATEYRESAPVTAHELAAKEAESDALKRALKNFGDQFGLALYDKDAVNAGHVTTAVAQVATTGSASTGSQSQFVAPDNALDRAPAGDGSFVMPIGKHKNEPLSEIPRSYLSWCLENMEREDIKNAIRAYFGLVTASMVGGGSGDLDIPFEATIDGAV